MKKTILVADDDASVRESVDHVLRDAGYESVLTAGGIEAVEKMDLHAVDLVLLDLGAPNPSGLQTSRHLAREHSGIPIIVMTGYPGQFKSVLASGASALIEKPFDVRELLQTIQMLLSRPKESDPFRLTETFYYIAHDPRPMCDIY